MPYYMYVSLQDDDKIAIFTMDAGTGKLTPQGEVPVSGRPSPLTMSPDRKVLYVGHRTIPGISSLRIDPDTGALRYRVITPLAKAAISGEVCWPPTITVAGVRDCTSAARARAMAFATVYFPTAGMPMR